MSYFLNLIKFWVTSEFYSVGLAAFIGVAIRVQLENAFSYTNLVQPPDGFGPYITILYSQKYLVSNFLGCFLMGAFIAWMKSITDISTPLYKALTTGLCGCITTFSSWMNVAVDMLWGEKGSQFWFFILVMICFEFWLTWCAFNLGTAAVKILTEISKLVETPVSEVNSSPAAVGSNNPSASQNAENIASQRSDSDSVKVVFSDGGGVPTAGFTVKKGKSSKLGGLGAIAEDEETQGGVRATQGTQGSSFNRDSTVRRGSTIQQKNRSSTVDIVEALIGALHSPEERQSFLGLSPIGMTSKKAAAPSTFSVSVWREDGPEDFNDQVNSTAFKAKATDFSSSRALRSFSSKALRSKSLNAVNRVDMSTEFISPTETEAEHAPLLLPPPSDTPTWIALFVLKNEFYFWAGMFWVALAIIFIVAFNSTDKRNIEENRSVALAPIGAWIRWGLTRLPWVKASWPEMNPQTLLANTIAVTVMCCLLLFAPQNSWTAPVNDGIMGSCSTVSTFFAELHSLYFEKSPLTSLRYAVATFGIAIVIIQIIRGGAAGGP